MAKIVGGCSCGKVRYSAEADPIFSGICHCKSCQKTTGTSFSVVIAIPAPALTVTGDVKVYDSTGDSGQATHSTFCPNCGSPVIGTADIMQGVVMIRAGTLDDSSWLAPAMEIYCEAKMPWVSLGGDLKSFPKMPEPG
ncbi:MAG: GFA family protein [Acetobacteraceae bacterium]|nr:GFA family protein [Acetobacteraceae bacterium]